LILASQRITRLDVGVAGYTHADWISRYGSLVEAWLWGQAEEELVDRQASPWDEEYRRPSHADRRKALQRQMLRAEIQTVLAGRPTKEEIRNLAERLLELAA